jgi:SAM-dependent methyltransferase
MSPQAKLALLDVRPAEREFVACHACDSPKHSPFLTARGFTVVRCSGCGLLFVNPQPTDTELAELYATHDQGDQWRVHEDQFNGAVRRQIEQLRRAGSVLDVGCGSGNFLRVMRDGGFSVTGIERSESGWEYAVGTHGLDVFHGSVEGFLKTHTDRGFDVITLLNVFEHLKQPRATLTTLAKLSNQGGLLVMVVPDARLHELLATVRRFAGSSDPFWMKAEVQPIVAIDPPFHLTCFEPRTLRLMVENCGFRVAKLANAPVISNPQLWKRISKRMVAVLGNSLRIASLGRVVIGYSTILVAEKL